MASETAIDLGASRFGARRSLALRRARKYLEGGIDAAYVTKPTDIRYLSGSTEGSAGLLFGRSWAMLFTNQMFRVRATREAPGCDIVLPRKSVALELCDHLRARGKLRLGVQLSVMTVGRHQTLVEAAQGIEIKDIGQAVSDCRCIKDEEEIRLTDEAVRIAESAFTALTGKGAQYLIGKTENEVAAELDYLMRLGGATRQAFPGGTIVAVGPNSYNCHHVPGNQRVERGDPILIDWGAELQGYRSDITRVVFAGSAAPQMREIYGVVLDAHDRAVQAMRPGVMLHTVDAIARKVIAEAGYAEAFRHGLGHGIGLEVHEAPGFGGRPRSGRGKAMRKHMIITVEPGVYLEGVGGVRIEDDVLLIPGGHRRLNALPRGLEQMILH